jgi:hypothetical protein
VMAITPKESMAQPPLKRLSGELWFWLHLLDNNLSSLDNYPIGLLWVVIFH